jgi:hypothetical protein
MEVIGPPAHYDKVDFGKLSVNIPFVPTARRRTALRQAQGER